MGPRRGNIHPTHSIKAVVQVVLGLVSFLFLLFWPRSGPAAGNLYSNATAHPASEWTQQQPREAILADPGYQFLIHGRSGIFSREFDATAENMGLCVIKAPYRSPRADSIRERAIGTLRRECLDHLIPLTGNHLRRTLRGWVVHYNTGRPHSALGPGIPEPSEGMPVRVSLDRYRHDDGWKVQSKSILGGLRHEYRLIPCAACGGLKLLRSTGRAAWAPPHVPIGRGGCAQKAVWKNPGFWCEPQAIGPSHEREADLAAKGSGGGGTPKVCKSPKHIAKIRVCMAFQGLPEPTLDPPWGSHRRARAILGFCPEVFPVKLAHPKVYQEAPAE